jgi:ADP-ribose pyrophosphatase
MVSQWRHATGREMLEIPAGTLDPDEKPRATAERELGEECGLAADAWEQGPSFFTAPGFCTERLTLFLATGLHATEATAPDDELLERSWMSLPDAMAAVDDGRVIDAKSVAGILWLAHRLATANSPA